MYLSYKKIYLNLMSKPCLEASLFVTPIFIYSEAGVFFWGGVTLSVLWWRIALIR